MATMFADVMHIVQFLATSPAVLALVVLLVISTGAAYWLRRIGRSNRHFLLLFAALASVALIIVMTLLREGLHFGFMPGRLLRWSDDGWQRASYDVWNDAGNLLNVALFVPAGVAWTLLTGKPLRVLAALMGTSFLVECLQAVSGAGANDVADLIANSAGAALGVLAGTIVLWLALPVLGRRPWPAKRQVAVGAGLVAAVAAVAIVGVPIGAEHRQATLERELAGRFAGTSLEQYRTWEAEDRVTEEVFKASSIFADGAGQRDDMIRVRYPASFFGLSRCVFVEWTPGAVRIYRGFGAECVEFFNGQLAPAAGDTQER